MIVCFISTAAFTPMLAVAESSGPDSNTFFEYKYTQKVNKGKGAYYEYTEKTKGEGRYDVISWGDDEAVMRAHYSWSYKNNEGGRDSSSEDRTFSFSITNRTYTSDRIDLDDDIYVSEPVDSLAQWLWIPTNVKKGDRIRILDETYKVKDTDVTLWSRWIPRKVIEVVLSGNGERDDDYGKFDYTFTDKLYFDKVTGMFFAERYEEFDEGSWEGEWGKFKYSIAIDVTDSSYEVEIDWVNLIIIYFLILGFISFLVGGFAYLVYRGKYMTRTFRIKDLPELGLKLTSGDEFVFRRVWKMKDFPHLSNNATDYFGSYIKHWVEKSLLAKDRVIVAVSSDHDLYGLAIYNKEGKIGTILCKNTEITEILRGYAGCKDFFSERRHRILITNDMRKDSTLMKKLVKSDLNAYNIFETYTVYRLDRIEPTVYDTGLVRPMKASDLKKVIKLAKKIYRSRAKRWIRACFNSGDLGYVAVVNGEIVGFGFGCIEGNSGRLHTLGVAKEHRGKGIAKELHRARLEAMRIMGVETVIDEIADWNLASKRVSMLHGFKPVGKMYVESARSKKIKKNIVRR